MRRSVTSFGPVALTGVALSGIAWVALGIEVAFRRRIYKFLATR